MNELIKIENKNGIETVNARELHEFLEVGKDFTNWIKDRIEKYDFKDGVDYTTCSPNLATEIHGGHNKKEYYISLDMAKELSMVENNDKGKEARKYFIEVEKAAKQMQLKQPTGQELIALALVEAQRFLAEKDAIIESQKPAVQFMNDVTGSRDAIEMSQVAKIIDKGYGRNQLFDLLREHGITRFNNEPYQNYIDSGWFRVVEQKWQDSKGETHIRIKTLIYQKGIDGIIKLIDKCKARDLI